MIENLRLNQFVIIVAGGSGSRMGSKMPKQFMLVRGKPILIRTIEQFLSYSPTLQIILVLPAKEMQPWHALCEKHNFYPPIFTTVGGVTRFQSVKSGLQSIKVQTGLVAVHDGVRPFVTAELIEKSFATAAEKGTAVACVPLKDSARIIKEDTTSEAVNRSDYRLIQTPQTFRLDWMRQAFEAKDQSSFTDCASVLEHAGFPITLIDGLYENIKITTPEDMLWAETFCLER